MNNLKLAFNHLRKHAFFGVLNILGLSIGLACCLVAGLYIKDETGYDKQYKDSDRIYRVVADFRNEEGTIVQSAETPPALATSVLTSIPGVQNQARLFPGSGNKFFVRTGNKKFIEQRLYHADAGFFELFSIPFLLGDSKSALANPNSIVLTKSMATKYFGSENPVGKTILVDDWDPCMVTAVVQDVKPTSHFTFDFMVPLNRFLDDRQKTTWNWNAFYTYIKVDGMLKPDELESTIRGLVQKSSPDKNTSYHLQKLTGIHLGSHLKDELQPNGDKQYLVLFATAAFFILLMAIINYITLTTARAAVRAKEIGIRKVSGADSTALIGQFLSESILTCILAAILALFAVWLALPLFNGITGKNFSFPGSNIIPYAGWLFAASVFVGLLAGVYPAFYLSSFSPSKVFSGITIGHAQSIFSRKILVVAQFAIATTLVIGAVTIWQQVDFVQHTKLGWNREHVISVDNNFNMEPEHSAPLKNEWLQLSGVNTVSATDGTFVGQTWTRELKYGASAASQQVNILNADTDFIRCMHIELKQGRNLGFTEENDSIQEILLNETAVSQLGIQSPVIGKKLEWNINRITKEIQYATIVGVVRDFHFSSLKEAIPPFAIASMHKRKWNYMIQLNGAALDKTLAAVQAVWNRNINSRPFQYHFLDDAYGKLYDSEQRFTKLMNAVTAISIFISCLGLFGLASFTMQRRSKEISIRKVLGATVSQLTFLLSGELVQLMIVAILISFPVSYYLMHEWLQGFAYHIPIQWKIFFMAALISCLIGWLTISFQAIRSAIANPVDQLRAQ